MSKLQTSDCEMRLLILGIIRGSRCTYMTVLNIAKNSLVTEVLCIHCDY